MNDLRKQTEEAILEEGVPYECIDRLIDRFAEIVVAHDAEIIEQFKKEHYVPQSTANGLEEWLAEHDQKLREEWDRTELVRTANLTSQVINAEINQEAHDAEVERAARLKEFEFVIANRPCDPVYWDMHHRKELAAVIRSHTPEGK